MLQKSTKSLTQTGDSLIWLSVKKRREQFVQCFDKEMVSTLEMLINKAPLLKKTIKLPDTKLFIR